MHYSICMNPEIWIMWMCGDLDKETYPIEADNNLIRIINNKQTSANIYCCSDDTVKIPRRNSKSLASHSSRLYRKKFHFSSTGALCWFMWPLPRPHLCTQVSNHLRGFLWLSFKIIPYLENQSEDANRFDGSLRFQAHKIRFHKGHISVESCSDWRMFCAKGTGNTWGVRYMTLKTCNQLLCYDTSNADV